MKNSIKDLIKRVPFIIDLRKQVRNLSKQGAYPAGHYYSPIPARKDVLSYVKSRTAPASDLLGINLNEKNQREVLAEYTRFYHDLPFPEKQTTTHRYYYDNGWFSYSDAIFLYSFLRQHAPKRIIEIGSGFSLKGLHFLVNKCCVLNKN